MRAISVLLVEHTLADADSLVRELERSEWLVDHAVVDNERRLKEELDARSWHRGRRSCGRRVASGCR